MTSPSEHESQRSRSSHKSPSAHRDSSLSSKHSVEVALNDDDEESMYRYKVSSWAK